VACPFCGGGSRIEVAPGLYRCRSIVVTRVRDAVEDWRIRELEDVCDREYQEAPPARGGGVPPLAPAEHLPLDSVSIASARSVVRIHCLLLVRTASGYV